jgi:hypothetical protein
MPHWQIIWIEGRDGNVAHLAEHGVTPREAAEVLRRPIAEEVSRTSGLPIAFGFTRSGRKLAVVYEQIDEATVYPVTAYEVD